MDNIKNNNDLEETKIDKHVEIRSSVEFYSTNHSVNAKSAGVRIYEKRKGKEAYGSKSWKITKGEKIALYIVTALAILVALVAVIAYFLPIPTVIKVIVLLVTVVAIIGGVGGFILVVALRHNKKDPMEMKYYDVDYENNYITGKGYDNTKQISKEEFFQGNK